MQRARNSQCPVTNPALEDTTPVIVSGALAGLTGGVVGLISASMVSLVMGDGLTTPHRLVAALLMGSDALDRDNVIAAVMLGALITSVVASLAGVAFTWLRRSETRFRLLVAEGVGFGLVLCGLLWAVLPYVNPIMYEGQSPIPLVFAYVLFGASQALELPLRVGTLDAKEAREILGGANESRVA